VLNAEDEQVVLESADLHLADGSASRKFRSLLVSKSDILWAIPHETESQVRRRAARRTGLHTTNRLRAPIGVLIPPYYVTGTATLPPDVSRSRFDAAALTRFFALVDVCLHCGTLTRDEQVAVVHRGASGCDRKPAGLEQ
jgi:hypothetical protein